MKNILIQAESEEQLRLVEAFIKQHQIKSFIVEESKADKASAFDDIVRMLIPIL